MPPTQPDSAPAPDEGLPEAIPGKLQFRDIKALDTDVRAIVGLMHPDFDFSLYARAFADVVRLHIGDYPGYQASNTEYHDLTHTLAVLLATARVLHGVHLERREIGQRQTLLVLLSALFHDVGYVQAEGDTEGTGAKYTLEHVDRSIGFMRAWAAEHGLSGQDAEDMECIIHCTDLSVPLDTIPFASDEVRLLGCVLGSADILAQMADELYIEKLSKLYLEFREAGTMGYENEYELFQATHAFHNAMDLRLKRELDNVAATVKRHFQARWGVDLDLYAQNIRKNLNYLKKVLAEAGSEYKSRLRRSEDRQPPFI